MVDSFSVWSREIWWYSIAGRRMRWKGRGRSEAVVRLAHVYIILENYLQPDLPYSLAFFKAVMRGWLGMRTECRWGKERGRVRDVRFKVWLGLNLLVLSTMLYRHRLLSNHHLRSLTSPKIKGLFHAIKKATSLWAYSLSTTGPLVFPLISPINNPSKLLAARGAVKVEVILHPEIPNTLKLLYCIFNTE